MIISFWQALFLGVLQGISELFPVSSLGQTILIPALLGWNLDPGKSQFLAFLVLLHLATAIALFIFFWKDWKVVVAAYLGSAKRGKLVYDEASKFAWLLVAGTVVTALVGLVFEKHLRELFEDPKKAWIVAVILIVNGFVMLAADFLKKRAGQSPVDSPERTNDPAADAPDQRRRAEELTIIEGAAIGATQSFALLPGISRSGVTIVTGLLAGLSYEQATRFSFMLATPIIAAAALKEVPKLLLAENRGILELAIPAAVLAGFTAYYSTKFLMRFFQHHRLGVFGWYCLIFGGFSVVMLMGK